MLYAKITFNEFSKPVKTEIFDQNNDLLSLIVRDYNEKMIGFTSQTVEILTQTRDEAKSMFEKAIASKAAPAKKPAKAKAAAKPAAKKSAKKAA